MKTILLVGGAGFIGSHLVENLKSMGSTVFVYDCLKKPLIDNAIVDAYIEYRWKTVGKLADKLYVADVCDNDKVSEVVKRHSIDTIVYLAALLSVESTSSWRNAYLVQVEGLRHFLEASINDNNIGRFVFVSSSYVYGNFQQIPAPESHPRVPVDTYGRCKLIGEELTKLYADRGEFDFSIVRLSGVYGFGDTHIGVERIAPTLIHCATENEPLTIKSAGSLIDFTYIKDAVDGITSTIRTELAANQTYNISGGVTRTIAEFARIVKRNQPQFPLTILDEKPSTVPGIPKRGALDISKAYETLGYYPKFSIEAGVDDYITEYLNSLSSWRKKI